MKRFTPQEWEAICERCGLCCYYKTWVAGEWVLSDVPCDYLDPDTHLCTVYEHRHILAPDCVKLEPGVLPDWLPKGCAYRRIRDEEPDDECNAPSI